VSSRRVVSSYTVNNGQNQPRSFSVHYRDGRAHRLGRGFLGFGTVLTVESGSQAGRAEVYDNITFYPPFQVFPYAGSVVRSWSWVPELFQQYTQVAFEYTDRTMDTVPSGLKAGNHYTYFTLPAETRTRKSEDVYPQPGSNLTMLAFVADHAANPGGELLDTKELVSSVDPYGNVVVATRTTVDVDDIRTVSRHVDNDEATWLLGKVTSEVTCSDSLDEQKCRSTERSFNGRGEVEIELRGDPSDPETTRKTAYTRDDFGNLTLVKAEDELGNYRSACVTYEPEGIFPYAYSRLFGQVSRVAFDAGLGVPTAARDANGLETIWQHDAFGRTTREKSPDGVVTEFAVQWSKTGGPQQLWWALRPYTKVAGLPRAGAELDSLGRTVSSWVRGPAVKAVNGPNSVLNAIYTEDITYDYYGRVSRRSKPWMVGDPQLFTEYKHDNLGRVTSVKTPWDYETTYDYSGHTVVARFPAAGSMLATSSTTTVDPLGRTIEVIDGKQGVTTTTYGPFGAPRAVETPGGLFVTLRDAYGRVRTEVDPDRGTTTIDYDGFDEQTRSFDAAHREVVYAYDGIGRRVARLDNGMVTTRWNYDDPSKGYGRLADVTNPGGASKSYTYDLKGRVSSVALLLGGETFTSVYQYDASSNVSTIEYPQGPGGAPFRIKNEYDLYDNLVGVRDDIDANHPYYWRLDRINGAGQTSREVFGNIDIDVDEGHALFTERDYAADKGTLKAIRTKVGTAKVQDLAYTHDARLNLTSRIDGLQLGGNGSVTGPLGEHFTYDELDRLTSSSFDALCAPGGSCGGQALTYAANGNIATKSDVAGGAAYTYDLLNAHPHAVAQIGSLAYGYDAVGNQTSRPELSIEYTPFDLPKKYTHVSGGIPSGVPTTFEYDGDQMRVLKTTATEETTYAGDYERVTHFGLPAAPTEHRYSIRSSERVIAVVTRTSQDTRTAYLHADHLGSTDVITDGTGSALGTVLERRSYDAFGAKRNPAWGTAGLGPWAAKTTVGFTGHESEEEFGLVNMKGRIYDPRVGRFLTTDPLVSHPGFSQSWNPYSYVLNNPLNLVDPSGFESVDGSVTYPDNSSVPLPDLVVNPEPGVIEGSRLAHEINHDIPAAPQGDADMPAGDPLPPVGESLSENGYVQIEGGFVSGAAIGIVPGAGVAVEVGTAAGALDKGTRSARLGRSVGQLFAGAASVVLGGAGEIGGGALTVGGISAFVGVPVIVVSTTLVLNGAANVGLGARGIAQALMSKGHNDDGDRIDRGGRQPRVTKAGANSADKKMVDDAARQAGITDRRGFGDYVEEVKRASAKGGRDNFTWNGLLELADEWLKHGGK
jgi:RHS repeat-associated protein